MVETTSTALVCFCFFLPEKPFFCFPTAWKSGDKWRNNSDMSVANCQVCVWVWNGGNVTPHWYRFQDIRDPRQRKTYCKKLFNFKIRTSTKLWQKFVFSWQTARKHWACLSALTWCSDRSSVAAASSSGFTGVVEPMSLYWWTQSHCCLRLRYRLGVVLSYINRFTQWLRGFAVIVHAVLYCLLIGSTFPLVLAACTQS